MILLNYVGVLKAGAVLLGLCPASLHAQTIHFEILSKISTKKTPLKIQNGSWAVVHDMRIIPGRCLKEKDSFDGDVYRIPVRIILEQDSDEPIELYSGELFSSPRFPQVPIEHPLYDLVLVECD